MSPHALPRPDLALVDNGIPRLRAMECVAILLSHAPNREMITEEGVDDTLALIAAEMRTVRALLDRYKEHHEL